MIENKNILSIHDQYILIDQIYNHELENIPEFNGFEDNLKQFKIYEFDKEKEKAAVIGILKVIIINF